MSKFIKKLSKFKKNPRFSLLIGKPLEEFNDIVEFFPSVFWIKYENIKEKRKNLIYLQDTKLIFSTGEIDIVFVDDSCKDILLTIDSFFIKCRPIIFVKAPDPISIEQSNFFKKIRYQAVDIMGDYQIWRSQ